MLGQPAGDGGAVDFIEGADPADVQTICVVEPQAEALAARERRGRRSEGLFVTRAITPLDIGSPRIGPATRLPDPTHRPTGPLSPPPAILSTSPPLHHPPPP